MFKAIKDLKKVKLIAKYFQRQFNKDGPPLPEILAAPMKTPFTIGQVRAVIK